MKPSNLMIAPSPSASPARCCAAAARDLGDVVDRNRQRRTGDVREELCGVVVVPRKRELVRLSSGNESIATDPSPHPRCTAGFRSAYDWTLSRATDQAQPIAVLIVRIGVHRTIVMDQDDRAAPPVVSLALQRRQPAHPSVARAMTTSPGGEELVIVVNDLGPKNWRKLYLPKKRIPSPPSTPVTMPISVPQTALAGRVRPGYPIGRRIKRDHEMIEHQRHRLLRGKRRAKQHRDPRGERGAAIAPRLAPRPCPPPRPTSPHRSANSLSTSSRFSVIANVPSIRGHSSSTIAVELDPVVPVAQVERLADTVIRRAIQRIPALPAQCVAERGAIGYRIAT